MQSTPLSQMITDIGQWDVIKNIDDTQKVIAFDQAIRTFRKTTSFPWMMRKATLRIFADVYEYPVASDHDEMMYIDSQKIGGYADAARFFNTSLQQFFEDVNSSRNLMSEIWKDGSKIIGLNYKSLGLSSNKLSDAEVVSEYAASDDAAGVSLDNIVYKNGNGSVRVSVIKNSDVATIKNDITLVSDGDYKKKYHFRWVYLNSVPTSIEMRLQSDDSNYLSTTVTSQFSGESLKANDWNLIAQDLNTATEVGSFDGSSISSEKIIINGVTTGNYWLDESCLREWKLLDYWYYSKYFVGTNVSSFGTKEYFYNGTTGTFDLTDVLIGDLEWVDVIEMEAALDLVANAENVRVFSRISQKRKEAWAAFIKKYPNAIPTITTQKYRFQSDFNSL